MTTIVSLDRLGKRIGAITTAMRVAQYSLLTFPCIVLFACAMLILAVTIETAKRYIYASDWRTITPDSAWSLPETRDFFFDNVASYVPHSFSTTAQTVQSVSNLMFIAYAFLIPWVFVKSQNSVAKLVLLCIYLLHSGLVTVSREFVGVQSFRYSLSNISNEPAVAAINRLTGNSNVALQFVIFAFVMLQAVWLNARTRRDQNRAAMTVAPPSTGLRGQFLTIVGAPPNAFHSRSLISCVLLSYLSLSFSIFGVLVLTALPGVALGVVMRTAIAHYLSANWRQTLRDDLLLIGSFVAMVVVVLGFWFVVSRLTAACQTFARKLIRNTMTSALSDDLRSPILFLRSFLDDTIPLPEPRLGLLYRLFCLSERGKTLDQTVLEEGSYFGPVVALGNPADPFPPYGAARGYFEHNTWQENVALLSKSSHAIVLCLDRTAGVVWEVAHLSEQRLLDKTLFVLHPRHSPVATAREQIEAFQLVLGAEFAMDWDSIAEHSQHVVGFAFDRDGALKIFVSDRLSRIAYLAMLRIYLRAMLPARLTP